VITPVCMRSPLRIMHSIGAKNMQKNKHDTDPQKEAGNETRAIYRETATKWDSLIIEARRTDPCGGLGMGITGRITGPSGYTHYMEYDPMGNSWKETTVAITLKKIMSSCSPSAYARFVRENSPWPEVLQAYYEELYAPLARLPQEAQE